MWTRTRTFGPVEVEATFQWDPGNPTAGIPAGWGAETGVLITAPLGDTAITVFIGLQDRDKGKPIPLLSDWLIEDVLTCYRTASGRLITIALSDGIPRDVSLSELPQVLEVAQDAYEDYKTAERLRSAQEGVQTLEGYLAELRHAEHQATIRRSGSMSLVRMELVRGQEQLAEAHKELREAEDAIKQRGANQE